MVSTGDFKLDLPVLGGCLLLALIILTLLHVCASYFGGLTAVSDEKECLKAHCEDVSDRNFLRLLSFGKWAGEWSLWEGLPRLSLPISLSVVEDETIRSGIGNGKGVSTELAKFNGQQRLKPEFTTPPFPVYASQVPLSMAKIIMSRHTIRRPNLNRPRPAVHPSARRMHSMV